MSKFDPVRYSLVRPIPGTVREDERTASWTISDVTFDFLNGDQPPPPTALVFNCHESFRDDQGERIPVEVLALLDLEQGLRKAFKQEFGEAWDAVQEQA